LNTAKLKGIIAEKGFSQREVAKDIGMTEKTFYTKMKKGVFGTDEVMAMIKLLDIQNPADIFLSKE
jgi:DNA-binding Xre family transcriptional regulator